MMIHTNIPYSMLLQRIDFVLQNKIHPEIYFSAEELDNIHEDGVGRLAQTLEKHSLETSIHGPFMDLSPGGVDRKIKTVTSERFLKTIELAYFFKPKTIVFHAGFEKWKFDGNVKLWLDSSLQTWNPLIKEVEKLGLTIAIENVFEEKPDPLWMLLNKIHSPHFQFCFDTGHYHLFGKTPLLTWFETLGKFLGEVHLHDNHQEMDEHLPAGEGSFDFDQFFKLLSQSGLNPIYTIEPHEEPHYWRGLEAVKKFINKYQ